MEVDSDCVTSFATAVPFLAGLLKWLKQGGGSRDKQSRVAENSGAISITIIANESIVEIHQ